MVQLQGNLISPWTENETQDNKWLYKENIAF